MKIKMIPENKVYAGTPADIVRKISADAIFSGRQSAEEYLEAVSKRIPGIKMKGETFEERSEALISGMISFGMAKFVVEDSFVDSFEVRVLRLILGVSQEKFAGRLGVTLATVNRWEKGLNSPKSGAIISSLRI